MYTPTSGSWQFQLSHNLTDIWNCQSFSFDPFGATPLLMISRVSVGTDQKNLNCLLWLKATVGQGELIIFLIMPKCLSFCLVSLSKQVLFPNLQKSQCKGNKGKVIYLTPLRTAVVLWIQELTLTEQIFTLSSERNYFFMWWIIDLDLLTYLLLKYF